MQKTPAPHPAMKSGSAQRPHATQRQTPAQDHPVADGLLTQGVSAYDNSRSAHPAHLNLLHLQRALGNCAVGQLIQAKLTISHPDDPYEQEADRVADTVMRMPEPAVPGTEATRMQAKPLTSRITQLMQREATQPLEDEKDEAVASPPVLQRVPFAVREDADEEKVATKLAPHLPPQEDEQQQTVQTQVAHDPPIQRQAMEGEETAEEAPHSTPPIQHQMGNEEAIQTKRWNVQRTPLPGIRALAGRLAGHAIQRLCTECAGEKRQDEGQSQQMVHRQAALTPVPDGEDMKEQQVQRTGPQAPPPRGTPSLAATIHALNGRGSRLPDTTRAFFEPRFGADFSQVRVHTDARAAATANAIHAKAFTVGPNIAFGAGQYAPGSSEGQRLMAHELTHVVQQNGSHVQRAQPLRMWEVGPANGPHERRADRIAKSIDSPVPPRIGLAGRPQHGIGNISRATSMLVQGSWIGDRVDWVRTAIRDDNWAGSDPPGSYYVLNGLSMDDMVRVLRALTPADRKKLSDNLDEHGAGFDRSRLQLALANAATAPVDKAFRERSENLHWAIRSGNFAVPPDGAFYLLAAASGGLRERLLAALNRDALDALIAHKDEAISVPGGAEVVNKIEGKRAQVGPTSREKRLRDLLEGKAWTAFFTEFNGMNETDQMRFLMGTDLVALVMIREHIGAAAGIADQDRINYLLERATKTASTSLYIDASDHTYHWQPKYRVDNEKDLSRFIYFSQSFGNAPDIVIDINTISDAELSEEEAEQQFREAKPGPGGFLWPAKHSRSTLPNLWKVKQDVLAAMKTVLFDDILRAGIFVVQYLLNVVFPFVQGLAIRSLAALRRASLSTRWMMGSQAIKGRLPPTVPATVRPRATPQQLREMIANSGEYYTWRTPEGDIAANQAIRSTGQTNPMAPEGVYLAKGVKGLPYGNYAVSIKGAKFPIRHHPFRAEEFILNGEIPANEGVWYTAEDYAAASGAVIKP